ncbi:hypothetical protein [Alicyclobacillus acidiphilus]|uniref:hypothetical protein n=1 Tax=Alicyclobacillus acidiphilus TaxID=182455 RepID=UPI0009FAC858|nr:hypothetical protein [Alicyclobacillus acidiphilus]
MIFGFGFGSPLTSILMLLGTSALSFLLFRGCNRDAQKRRKPSRDELRKYYYEQRQRARELSAKFDLTDEEIEKKLDEFE